MPVAARLAALAAGCNRPGAIVREGEGLDAEALLLDRDIGFGAVEQVSCEAPLTRPWLGVPLAVEAGGAIKVNGEVVRLTPGLQVTAEVVTGRRRVIDELWSPVAKA